ncbi:MAG TPA: hypothetical protein VIM52_00875 [Stellaceae bacterium]
MAQIGKGDAGIRQKNAIRGDAEPGRARHELIEIDGDPFFRRLALFFAAARFA